MPCIMHSFFPHHCQTGGLVLIKCKCEFINTYQESWGKADPHCPQYSYIWGICYYLPGFDGYI